MSLADDYPELVPIIKGASFNQIFEWFFSLAQIRYATKAHLNSFNNKIGTPKKIEALIDGGFLGFTGDYFFTGPKALDILEKENFHYKILQRKFTGGVGEHQQELSSVIFNIMKEPFFYRCFYPKLAYKGDTRFIEPDACLIFKDGDRIKIEFLEVENLKPDETWKSHLEGKQRKYAIKGKCFDLYDPWWIKSSKKMNLPICKPEQFCFSVRCYSEMQPECEGWRFWE